MSPYTYTTIKHPRSGEVYAVEIGGSPESVVRAAGPLHYKDPTDAESIRDYLDNQPQEDTEENGQWLQAELDGFGGK